MTESVHCPYCGAPFREQDARFCSFCATERPAPTPPVVLAPNAPERFAAAERHPRAKELLAFTPSTTSHTVGGVVGIVFLAVFCFMAFGIVSGILGVGFLGCSKLDMPGLGLGTGLFVVIPSLVACMGVIGFVLHVRRVAKFQSATLDRSIALVVDKRTQASGEHATNYATLETKGRERREYELDRRAAGRAVLHDIGMAYVKGDVLLDFQRIDV